MDPTPETQQAFEDFVAAAVGATWHFVDKNPDVRRIWIYIGMEDQSSTADVAYEVGGRVHRLPQVHEALGLTRPIDDEIQQRLLHLNEEAADLEQIWRAGEEAIPTRIIVQFNPETLDVDSDYSDDTDPDKDIGAIKEDWFERLAKTWNDSAHILEENATQIPASLSHLSLRTQRAFQRFVEEALGTTWYFIDENPRVSRIWIYAGMNDQASTSDAAYEVDGRAYRNDEVHQALGLAPPPRDEMYQPHFDLTDAAADLEQAWRRHEPEVPKRVIIAYRPDEEDMDAAVGYDTDPEKDIGAIMDDWFERLAETGNDSPKMYGPANGTWAEVHGQ